MSSGCETRGRRRPPARIRFPRDEGGTSRSRHTCRRCHRARGCFRCSGAAARSHRRGRACTRRRCRSARRTSRFPGTGRRNRHPARRSQSCIQPASRSWPPAVSFRSCWSHRRTCGRCSPCRLRTRSDSGCRCRKRRERKIDWRVPGTFPRRRSGWLRSEPIRRMTAACRWSPPGSGGRRPRRRRRRHGRMWPRLRRDIHRAGRCRPWPADRCRSCR